MERADITPCIIDKRRDCPILCPLRYEAMNIIERMAETLGLDKATYVDKLRESYEEKSDKDFSERLARLERQKLAYRCALYVQIKMV